MLKVLFAVLCFIGPGKKVHNPPTPGASQTHTKPTDPGFMFGFLCGEGKALVCCANRLALLLESLASCVLGLFWLRFCRSCLAWKKEELSEQTRCAPLATHTHVRVLLLSSPFPQLAAPQLTQLQLTALMHTLHKPTLRLFTSESSLPNGFM